MRRRTSSWMAPLSRRRSSADRSASSTSRSILPPIKRPPTPEAGRVCVPRCDCQGVGGRGAPHRGEADPAPGVALRRLAARGRLPRRRRAGGALLLVTLLALLQVLVPGDALRLVHSLTPPPNMRARGATAA